jgi:hydroxyacylglutathione hydrolase
VDPGEATPVIRTLKKLQKEKKINITNILCTHKHYDHVGGNIEIKREFPQIEVIGTGYESIPSVDREVKHNDIIKIGSLNVQTLFTPCHTSGHVCFYVNPLATEDDNVDDSACTEAMSSHRNHKSLGAPILFAGDTLFAGGCGRFFEGTGKYESLMFNILIGEYDTTYIFRIIDYPIALIILINDLLLLLLLLLLADEMLQNMDILGGLPPTTHVYCGHEYTLSNLKFLHSLIPLIKCFNLQQSIERYYAKAIDIRSENLPTLPSTIADELAYNLFTKCREKEVQGIVDCVDDPIGTMQKLRYLKNNF